jgi:hypothetical protein
MVNPRCSAAMPPVEWGLTRRTHPVVVQAIFAVASERRSPEAIWESPTSREWQDAADLVAEYIDDGDFAFDSGRFAWGLLGAFRMSLVQWASTGDRTRSSAVPAP